MKLSARSVRRAVLATGASSLVLHLAVQSAAAEPIVLAQLLDNSREAQGTMSAPAGSPLLGQSNRLDEGKARTGADEVLSGPRKLPEEPTGQKAVRSREAAKVDAAGVWYHLNHGDPVAARRELEIRKADNPGWTPPAALAHALSLAEFRKAVAAGNRIQAKQALAGLGEVDRCAQPDIGWAIARLERDGRILLDMARDCADGHVAAASMDRFLEDAPASRKDKAIDALARQNWSPAVRRVLDRHALALDLAQLKRPEAARKLAVERLRAIEVRVRALRDAGGSDLLGWRYLDRRMAEQARARFIDAMHWSNGAAGRTGLARSLIALNQPQAALDLLPKDPALRPALADAFLQRAMDRLRAGEHAEVVTPDLRQAVRLGRTDAWQNAGWLLLDAGRAADAATMFAQAGTEEGGVYGRVLAERAAGHGDQARALACENKAASTRLAQACADSLAAAQLASYRSEDYAQTLRLGDQLAKVAPDRRDAQVLDAWASLKMGHPADAAQTFEALYDRRPDRDLAIGLVNSLQAAGEDQKLTARIAAGDPLLGDIVAHRTASVAYDRKQFALASALGGMGERQADAVRGSARSDDDFPALAGRDGWVVGSGLEIRHTQGDKGQGAMDIAAPRAFTEGTVAGTQVGVALVGARVADGTAAPGADLGSRPGTDAIGPLAATRVAVPILSLRREVSDWTLDGRLSSTPLSGPVSARPTGGIAASHYGDPVILSGQIFSQSVVGSMLSFTGLKDPVTGTSWGRVVETGGSVQAVFLPASKVSLALSGEGAWLDGVQVADNSREALRGDAAYDFRPTGFDHLRAGPFVSWAHFDRNLSHFTLGQGGYYSPDSDERAGILIDALTEEGRFWQLEAKTSAAYLHANEAASPRFPLTPGSGGSFTGSTSHGVAADVALRGTVLVAEHALISGFGRYSTAPGYNDFSVGLFLTIPLQPRQGVVSADLANSVLLPFH